MWLTGRHGGHDNPWAEQNRNLTKSMHQHKSNAWERVRIRKAGLLTGLCSI